MSNPDTIRILVSSDNHVGYNERDAKRKDDSWKTFHEIMCLAKERDVDMVLLAGDLFHDNKPSRKAMYQVMRSIRMNCFGDKPCELELLSDPSENFQGAFGHANYEDPDINVAIPIFSIHGNHDDPSGDGYLAALDILQMAGLINYYGRAPESDNISVKPVLLQKGRTKLALYGLSNVRDERLFRTFRDGKVKFFQPKTHKDEWFNILSVHQNHNAYTDTGYLPESFLPSFMDMVIWGHEHECLIEPRFNPEMGFHVMQPGSSVATSLVPGEALMKQVSILSVTGREFRTEPIRLKTVRPFVMKEIALAEERALRGVWKKEDNRMVITRHLTNIVHELIQQAKDEWTALQDLTEGEKEPPAPLIRLRVEYTAPEGGHFDCENPQRISNRFINEVANVNDVIQFHRRKAHAAKKTKNLPEAPDAEVIARMSMDAVKVQQLVQQFLVAQSLTILPQNSFGDAVSQFVEKDDKHAMEVFVQESLANQTKYLLQSQEDDEEIDISAAMEEHRSKLEELFARSVSITNNSARGEARSMLSDGDDAGMDDEPYISSRTATPSITKPTSRATALRQTASSSRTNSASAVSRRSVATRAESEVESEQDAMMIDEQDSPENSQQLFVQPTRNAARTSARAAASASSKPPPQAVSRRGKGIGAATQARSSASSARSGTRATPSRPAKSPVIEESEDDDDDDAFEPVAPSSRFGRRL